MKGRLATLAAASMLALALGAAPAMADSSADGHAGRPVVTHKAPSDITGFSLQCGRNTYTVTSGTSNEVDRLWPATAAGDVRGTETWTLKDVWAVDQYGRRYAVSGWQEFDGTYNPTTGGPAADGPFSSFSAVQKLQIGYPRLRHGGPHGGTRDGSSLEVRQLSDGSLQVDVSGTCAKDPWYSMLW